MIHPEIKKFWEDAGYKISSMKLWDKNRNDIIAWHRYITPFTGRGKIIARYFEINGNLEMKYYLDPSDDKKSSEEEMLKLIRLKAFW